VKTHLKINLLTCGLIELYEVNVHGLVEIASPLCAAVMVSFMQQYCDDLTGYAEIVQ
jgi:hypothetical protein